MNTTAANATVLNSIERALVEAVEAGRDLLFTDSLLDSAAGISADLIRSILVGLPIQCEASPAAPRNVALRSTGIRIMPAVPPADETARKAMRRLPIIGRLGLARLRGMDGGPLPDLELTYCTFADGIDLSGAALGPVSLEGSQFPALCARDASFQGGVCLDWCGPFAPTPAQTGAGGQGRFPFVGRLFTQGAANAEGSRPSSFTWLEPGVIAAGVAPDTPLSPCVIDLTSADILGQLRMSFATFCCTAETCHLLPDHQLRHAVNLSGVSVRDTVFLTQTVVYGGLGMKSLEVGEDLWFSGARLVSRHRASTGKDESVSDALTLQLAQVKGLIGFIECADDLDRKRTDFQYNIVIGGVQAIGLQSRQLWISHGLFAGYLSFEKGNFTLGAIFGPYSQLSGAPLALFGTIDLSYASVENNLEFGEVHGFILPEHLLSDPYVGIHVGSMVARIVARELKAGGSLLVRQCHLTATKELTDHVLYLRDTSVADSITIENSTIRGISLRASRVSGGLKLRGVNLDLGGTRIRHSDGEPWGALDLRDSTFDHNVEVRNVRWGQSAAASNEAFLQNGAARITPQPKDRAFDLSFYDDVVVVDRAIGRNQYQRYLYDTRSGTPLFMLDGQAQFIHMLNNMGRLRLETREQVEDYLTFFCDSVAGDGGSFKILDETMGPGADRFVPLQPITPDSVQSGEHTEGPPRQQFMATILYGDGLFVSTFSVAPDGMIEMLGDEPIADKVRNKDRFPRRTRAQKASPAVRVRDYAHTPSQISFSATQQAEERLFYAHLDLEGLHCGALLDDFGRGWGLPSPERDNCHVQLHAAGIRCGRVEPSADAGKSATGNDPRDAFSAAEGQRDHKAAHHRLAWLRYQTGFEDRNTPSRWRHIPLLNRIARSRHVKPEHWKIAAVDFVPQVYDEFSTAHYRAGEPEEGQRILIAKKDAENRLMREASRTPFGREEHHIGWLALLSALLGFTWWMAGGPGGQTMAGLAEVFSQWPYGSILSATAAIAERWAWVAPALFAAFIGFRALRGRREWRLFWMVWLPSIIVSALVAFALSPMAAPGLTWQHDVLLFAILVLWVLLLVYSAWPWVLGIFHFLFKHGFSYGLSPARAIMVCAGLLVLGTAMTGLARTGSLAPNTDWGSLYDQNGQLKRDIALVLDVQFQAQIPDGQQDRPGPAGNDIHDRDRQMGATVVAQPTACDVGVNNFLYAADVFVPLVDLEQESRCTIRTAPENARNDPYLFWRIGKSLYEIIGWIVISLSIVTISGVMRRDIER